MNKDAKNIDKALKLLNSNKVKEISRSHHSYSTFKVQESELMNERAMQLPLENVLAEVQNSPNFDLLTKNLANVQSQFLYKSHQHGILHNLRASILGFYIADKMGLDRRDITLCLYSTLYHDIGRRNDEYDLAHGALGAARLKELNLDVNNEEMKILKFIITCHSLPDSKYDEVMQKVNIADKECCFRLYKILKDADGLDRVRLEEPYVGINYLRTDEAKSMILAAFNLEYNLH